MRRIRPILAALLVLAAVGPVVAEMRADEVRIRVEPRTYPVSEGKRRGGIAPDHARKLRGKDSYTTDAVILENRHLELVVLPELGGRLVHAVYKPAGEELFWVNDEIQDGVSWSMGGGRWSFPFWEHGRHFDETGGYAIVRHDDGSVTLAVDMRFGEFLKPSETRRYGRATCLRLAQFVHLAPDEARFTWTGRVTNPLPVRCGFKLWYLLRQPAVDGTEVILPTAAVTGHGSRELRPWDPETVVRDLSTSVFAVGMRHDFAGWYFPERDLNVLALKDRRIAPGAKMVLYPPSTRGYVEMWGGSNEVFEECGRFLPTFGAYEMKVTVVAAQGVRRADFADEDAVVSLAKKDGPWFLRFVTTRPREALDWEVAGGRRTGGVTKLEVAPEKPYGVAFERPGKEARLVLKDRGGAVLLDQTFPLDRGPLPVEHFRGVQARTNMTLAGGPGLYAEATDLVSEHQLSLPKTTGLNETVLERSEDVRELTDAARRLMRVRKNDPKVLAGLEKALAKAPDDPHANLYKAIWLMEADRLPHELLEPLQLAAKLPGGRYLLALAHVRQGDLAEAVDLLRSFAEMKPQDTFAGTEDPSLALLQPGAAVANQQPLLLLATLYRMRGRSDEVRAICGTLLAADPALTEAWMLLAEIERASGRVSASPFGGHSAARQVRTLTAANPGGRREAEANLAALRAARWPGIPRP